MIASWKKVKRKLQGLIPDHCYRMWIDPLTMLGFDEDLIQLSSPNSFTAKRLKTTYLPTLKQEFSKIGHGNIRIEFVVKKTAVKPAGEGEVKPIQPVQNTLPGLDMRFDSGRLLKKGFTFDDFVVGKNSDFAYSASLSLAGGGGNGSGVLYLLSKTGLGKSHLAQAVGHHIITHDPLKKVFYVTAEDFTNEMISSLRNNTIHTFKEKYRNRCDFLILEDVHFLSGKDATQKELAVTFDYLLDADKKIIFSGGISPEAIPKLNDRLKSRLSMGLVTSIAAPDYQTRVRILKKKSKTFGYDIPREIIDYIADGLCGDVRQLESGLFGVAAKARLLGRHIDIALARSVIGHMVRNKKQITNEYIKELTCKEFSISQKDIMSRSRKQRIAKPRQIAMYLARKYTDLPLKQIALGYNRYHATAVYSINAVEKELKQRGVLFEQVNYLSKKIESGGGS